MKSNHKPPMGKEPETWKPIGDVLKKLFEDLAKKERGK